jgi:hypothetical protein
MIITEIDNNMGLGNQLFCYATTRAIAYKKSYEFGIQGAKTYKGKDIIDLDFGMSIPTNHTYIYIQENLIRSSDGVDISPADDRILNCPDGSKLAGNLQAMSYIKDYKKELTEWLSIKPEKVINNFNHDDCCILHLRGGDHIGAPANSFLQMEYYARAMQIMKSRNPNMKFYMVSDDIRVANIYCKELDIYLTGSLMDGGQDKYKASHHIGGDVSVDYAILNSCRNVIMSNSTFAFWPVWTNKNNPFVICPKFWFGHNRGYWSTGDMQVDEWNYLDKDGNYEETTV